MSVIYQNVTFIAPVAPEKDGGEGGGNLFQSVALDSFKFDKKLGRTMLRILGASVGSSM
jgi:hypothetical protein